MYNFPEDDDFFENNKSLKSLVKSLESYIEILFEMESVITAICALKECSFKKQEVSPIELSDKEKVEIAAMLNSFQSPIDKYERNKKPIHDTRDNLWKIKNELGLYNTLMFINPKLVLSLEMVFSGAIIAYSKAFNSSGRGHNLKGKGKKVFKGDNALLTFHNEIIDLRNKQFAHSEYEYSRHILKYILTGEKDLHLETSSHTHSEFWINFDYTLFYKLVTKIQEYLSNEINIKVVKIKEKLSPSQLEKLRQMEKETRKAEVQ